MEEGSDVWWVRSKPPEPATRSSVNYKYIQVDVNSVTQVDVLKDSWESVFVASTSGVFIGRPATRTSCRTVSIRDPAGQNWHFKTNPRCFSNPDKVVFVPKPNQEHEKYQIKPRQI